MAYYKLFRRNHQGVIDPTLLRRSHQEVADLKKRKPAYAIRKI